MKPPLKSFNIPNSKSPNSFGAIRKHDIHTGVDLFCEEKDEVFSIYDGIVVSIEQFTGFDESPWWNDTYSVLVYNTELNETILYGEIEPCVEVGDRIVSGEKLGHVIRVLKKYKGTPMDMLHIERYQVEVKESVWWYLNESKPELLLDVTEILENLHEKHFK